MHALFFPEFLNDCYAKFGQNQNVSYHQKKGRPLSSEVEHKNPACINLIGYFFTAFNVLC